MLTFLFFQKTNKKQYDQTINWPESDGEKDIHELKEEKSDKLFYCSLNPLPLLGSPQLTAESFVNRLIDDRSLVPLELTKTQLIEKLNDSDVHVDKDSSMLLMDKPCLNLCNIEKDSIRSVVQPLKKLFSEASSSSNVKRPRERFLAERKLKSLEPELKEWKDKYDTLRKYRKAELSKAAALKIARSKRDTRRKKRREWIKEQIKLGKMHRSALIWVNSNKVLPYERQEKKLSNQIQSVSQNPEGAETSMETELLDAVESIQADAKFGKEQEKNSPFMVTKITNET